MSFTDPFTLKGFNTALGTLTSVVMGYASTITTSISVHNSNKTSAQSFTSATASVPVTITGPDGSKDTATATANYPGVPVSVPSKGTVTASGVTSTASNTKVIPSADWWI